MADMTFKNINSDKSSIKGLATNVLGALVFLLSASLAWIPVVGYFAWLVPLAVYLLEKKSPLLRFYCAEAFIVALIRMVFDVVFNSIASLAQQTVALYGNSPDFIAFYGNVLNPGGGALLLGGIFGGLLTLLGLALAFFAFYRMPIKLPLVSSLCKAMAQYKLNTDSQD